MRVLGGDLTVRCAVALACATVCLAAPAAANAGAANRAALQVALRLHGTYAGPIDGIFGPQTRRAVRRFQRHKGLAVDGVAGRRTLAALGPFARHRLGSRLLRARKVGWDVAALQFLLVRCEVPVGAVDGVFGEVTRRAVVRYQRRAGLVTDGVAGVATTGGLRKGRGCREVRGRVPSGVTVGGIALAGLTAQWTEAALRSAFARPVELRARDRSWLLDPDGFARPEVYRAVRKALRARPGAAIPLRVDVHSASIRRFAAAVADRLCRPPSNATLVGLRALRPRISRAHAGCRIERRRLARTLIHRFGGLGRAAVRVPINRIPPAVTRANFGPVVVVRRASHRLFLYDGTETRPPLARRHGAIHQPDAARTLRDHEQDPTSVVVSTGFGLGGRPAADSTGAGQSTRNEMDGPERARHRDSRDT